MAVLEQPTPSACVGCAMSRKEDASSKRWRAISRQTSARETSVAAVPASWRISLDRFRPLTMPATSTPATASRASGKTRLQFVPPAPSVAASLVIRLQDVRLPSRPALPLRTSARKVPATPPPSSAKLVTKHGLLTNRTTPATPTLATRPLELGTTNKRSVGSTQNADNGPATLKPDARPPSFHVLNLRTNARRAFATPRIPSNANIEANLALKTNGTMPARPLPATLPVGHGNKPPPHSALVPTFATPGPAIQSTDCQNVPTRCPSDTECSRWSCEATSTTDFGEGAPLGCVREFTECLTPTNRCTKHTCTSEGLCVAEDLPRPDDLTPDDFCREFQCHPATGEWQNRTTVAAQECLSKEGSGCAEWMCDSEHGCLLSVRLGCCEEGEVSNCTTCEEVTGCIWDATSESCEAIANLPLELATALPSDRQRNLTNHNNWEELISGCPTAADGGGRSDSNTPAIVAGAVSAGVGVLAALGAAGAFAWRMQRRRSQLKNRLSVLPPTTPLSNFTNPLFTAPATEGTNPLYPGNS